VLSQQIQLSEKIDLNDQENFKKTESVNLLTIKQQQTALNLQTLKQQGLVFNQEVEDLKRLLKQEQIILSLAGLKQQVQPDQACPLCGSLEHPALENYTPLDSSDTEKRLQDKEQQLTLARNKYSDINSEYKTEVAQLVSLNNELQELQKNKGMLLTQWQESYQQTYNDNSSKQLRDHLVDLKAKQENLNQIQMYLQQLTEQLQKVQSEEQLLQQQLTTQQQKVNTCNQNVATLDADTKANSQLLAKETELLVEQKQKIIALLDEQQAELLFYSPQAWLLDQQQKIADFEDDKKQAQVLSENIQQLKQDALLKAQILNQLKEKSDKLTQDLLLVNEQLLQDQQQRLTEFGDKTQQVLVAEIKQKQQQAQQQLDLALANQQQLLNQQIASTGEISSLEIQIKDRESEQLHQQTLFSEKLLKSDFDDQQALQNAMLTEAEINELQVMHTNLNETLISQRSKLCALTERHQAHIKEQINQASLEQLQLSLTTLEQDNEQINQQWLTDKSKLNNDLINQQKQAGIIAEQQKRKEHAEYWQLLNSMIGAADGNKYREFVQGLTLDNLVQLANQEMANLHQRYQLKRNQDEKLALQVIDVWQANTVRDVKTLSGGESFLVSLGLALALSNLVSHKTQIESLFLDEGFGTLDANTLEVALEALERLNASGKLIGIISHVDALKERINHQIHVAKGASAGFSQLAEQYKFVESVVSTSKN